LLSRKNLLTFGSVFVRRKARKARVLNTKKADSLITLFVRESEGKLKKFQLVRKGVTRR
jgi:hypothetical protein